MFTTAITALTVMLAALWVTPIFPFLYVILRWRTGNHYPHGVGTHGALLYFITVGILVALAGAANLTYGLISVTPVDQELTRLSWGLLVGGLVFSAINVILRAKLGVLTDSADVGRIFVGFVMVLTGMIAMGALISLFVTIFREATNDAELEKRTDAIRMFASWTIYFLAAYLLSARSLARTAGAR